MKIADSNDGGGDDGGGRRRGRDNNDNNNNTHAYARSASGLLIFAIKLIMF